MRLLRKSVKSCQKKTHLLSSIRLNLKLFITQNHPLMPRINNEQRSFSSQCFENSVRPNAVALRINQIIDWKPIENMLDQAYTVGRGNMGRKASYCTVQNEL